jgi:glycosyltransferase involved in cell wall biosynthesis
MTAKTSCVICTYNEAERIRDMLDVVIGHPSLDEVIVVNDGSTDETEELLQAYPRVRVISYAANRGKTYALARGIDAAQNDLVMLLDADLVGITPENIEALAEAVTSGNADVSISLRGNSLTLFRLIGIDFISGERVIPKSLLRDLLTEMERLPRWGGEVFMNQQIVSRRMRVTVVRWPNALNVRKYRKVGMLRGFLEEVSMIRDALQVVTPYCALRQMFELVELTKPGPSALLERNAGWLARHRVAAEGSRTRDCGNVSSSRRFAQWQNASMSPVSYPSSERCIRRHSTSAVVPASADELETLRR